MFRGFQLYAALIAGMLSFAVAGGAAADEPALVLSVRSVDVLLEEADYVGGKIGMANVKKFLENWIIIYTRGKGLAGLDRTKPLGSYQQSLSQSSVTEGVIFVPIADEDNFIALLKTLAPDLSESEGVWSMTQSGIPYYGKFSKGYFFITPSEHVLADLVDPVDIVNEEYDISWNSSIAAIPQELKDEILSNTERQWRANLANGPESSTGTERTERDFALEQSIDLMKLLANDVDRILIGIDIESESGLGTFDIVFSSKEGSALHSAMQKYAEAVPLYASVVSDDAPLAVVVSLPTTGILEHLDGILEQIQVIAEKEVAGTAELKTEEARTAVMGFVSRLPEIAHSAAESGALHSVMVLEKGNDDSLQLIAGTHVGDAEKAQSLLEDSIASKSSANHIAKVSLDVDKHEGARIHAIETGSEALPTKIFGEEDGHFAVAKDSLWIAIGGGNLAALKEALEAATRDSAEEESPVFVAAHPAELVLMMEKTDQALLSRARAIAGTAGDVLKIEIVPVKTGAKLHIEFGADLLTLTSR